jgi:branched-subunit amino acid ABC-type transport system permease component
MDPLHRTATRLRIFRWPLFAALCLVPALGGCAAGAPFTLAGFGQQLLIGLVLGSVYALLALGYTLVYGVIKLINFAHADLYMLGAFCGYYVLRLSIRWLHFTYGTSLPLCFLLSAVVSSAVCALLAVVMERLAYRPLRKTSRIAALITAVGVSFLIENGGLVGFGANPKSFEPKTLEVYQLQLAPAADFGHARQVELLDQQQRTFPAGAFRRETFARVRVVSQHGTSDWSPVLDIAPGADGGHAEAAAPAAADAAQPPGQIGFRRDRQDGQDIVVLNWQEEAGADAALSPVFAGPTGQPLALSLQHGALRVPLYNLLIVLVTLATLYGLNLLVNRSMFGIAMRALSFDLNAAKLMGIDTDRAIAQTFAIGGACAGLAGCMVGLYNSSIDPLMGILPGLKAFVAAVVGGIGSIPGAALGGLIMGVSESLLKGYLDPAWSGLADALAFALLIVVLLFKPSGLLGRAVREKV